MTASPEAAPDDRVRLHITPFSEALLASYIPPSIQSSATNISYHAVQTFPDKGFGYVELPKMEAQKLKRKLNGAVLKGQKIRIEKAKPEKHKTRKSKDEGEDTILEEDEAVERPKKRAKKEGRKEGVLPGVELPGDRTVKRGWTESVAEKREKKKKTKSDKGEKEKKDRKDKSKTREASKYTTAPEMLFKTKLPPNIAASAELGKKRKKKDKTPSKGGQDVVVHEFEHTQKHSNFLKSDDADLNHKPASEYVEGKGWIDEEGSIVDAESELRRKKKSTRLKDKKESIIPSQESTFVETPESRPKPTNQGVEELNGVEAAASKPPRRASVHFQDTPSTPESSPEPSSEEPSSPEPSTASDSASESEDIAKTADDQITRPTTSRTDTTSNDEEIAEAPENEVHPLEALYKRPKLSASSPSKPLSIKTGFSFFGDEDNGTNEAENANDDDDAEASLANPPLTPYTRRDREFRGMRSAAPTPDTAMRERFTFPSEDESDEDDGAADEAYVAKLRALEEEAADNTAGPEAATEESEFAKWFWDNRGDNNRAWKKRRREALKVKRRRDNRRISRRVV